MKKPIFVFITILLFALVCTNAFAGANFATFQIINADTFEIISEGTLQAGSANYRISENDIKSNVRRQLGFPSNSDTRTAGGVTQRIIWVSVRFEE